MLAVRDEAVDDIELWVGIRRVRRETRRMPYPFAVPANYLRADLISREHRNLTNEVKVCTCGHTLNNLPAFGPWGEHLPARAIQPPVRA